MRRVQVLNWMQDNPYYTATEPYQKFLTAQDRLWEQRLLDLIPDTLVLARHPPTISIGSRPVAAQLTHVRPLPRDWLTEDDETLFQKTSEFLATDYHINLVRAHRGGSIWYHDQGVLQLYVILEAPSPYPAHISRLLEETLYKTCMRLEIPELELFPLRTQKSFNAFLGVWTSGKKIGAIGVSIYGNGQKKITRFGASLNICPDMRRAALINPCGIEGKEITSVALARGGRPSQNYYSTVLPALYESFEDVFETKLQ